MDKWTIRTILAVLAVMLAAACESSDGFFDTLDAGNVMDAPDPGGNLDPDGAVADARDSVDLAGISDDGDLDPGIANDGVADDLPDDPGQDSIDVEDVRELPPFTPGACGQEPYEWLPRDDMGKVLTWEEDVSFLLDPATVDAMLAAVGYPFLSPVDYGTRVFFLRYTTQDRGVPREATAVVGIPILTGESPMVLPTVLWLHGTTGFNDGCAPTSDLSGPAAAMIMASQGFVTVAPDYLGLAGFGEPSGMFHPYLVGEPTAIASWDAVRAAHDAILDMADANLIPENVVVPWGASQGGHASVFVDRYAPYYAPEFQVPGVVAGIPPTDLVRQGKSALKSLGGPAALLTVFLVQATRWYLGDEVVADLLTDHEPHHFASTMPVVLDTVCGGNPFGNNVTLEDLFRPEFLVFAEAGTLGESEPWGCFLRQNSLNTIGVVQAVDTPILMVQAEFDDLVDVPAEREAFDELCSLGIRMQYIECEDAGHSAGAVWSLPEQMSWVRARLAGEPIDAGELCVRGEPGPCSARM